MKYLLLIYTNEAEDLKATPEEQQDVINAYYAFDQELSGAGKKSGGEALHPTHTATSVRVREGKTITSDGPFAETKEQLGGFYFIEAEDLDEAIGWAAKIPGASIGTIEVRPVMEFN